MATNDPAEKRFDRARVYVELKGFREYASFVALVRGQPPVAVSQQNMELHIVIRSFREYVEFVAVTRGEVLNAEQLQDLDSAVSQMKIESDAVETSLGDAPK